MIAYLHGFNSSPQSHKARLLSQYLAVRNRAPEYLCPELPPSAREAVAIVEALMQAHRGPFCFVGSSLGGFYATYLAEKHDARAVLVNPAITPHVGLRPSLGPQRNLYTGASYELTAEHLRQWEELYCARVSPRRYLLLVETGDEVLDYREAVARYAGAEQVVIPGGDHSLQSFTRQLPRILQFADTGR